MTEGKGRKGGLPCPLVSILERTSPPLFDHAARDLSTHRDANTPSISFSLIERTNTSTEQGGTVRKNQNKKQGHPSLKGTCDSGKLPRLFEGEWVGRFSELRRRFF